MPTVRLILLLLVLAATSRAADLRVRRASDHTIWFQQHTARHEIVLPESVEVHMDDAVLLAWRQVDHTQFLLLLVRGPSRGGDGRGYCGCGIEAAVVWLKLQDWAIAALQQRRVESCFYTVDLRTGPSWENGVCTITFWDIPDHEQEFTLRYDSKQPADGFTLTAKPIN